MDAKIKADAPLSAGVDCSRYIYLAARRAGMPVRRTTAHRMALGESGWAAKDIPKLEATEDLDIIWWTLKPTRPCGHVGVIWWNGRAGGWKANKQFGRDFMVTHASAGRGRIVVDRIRGWVITSMSALKRLTIGD